MKPLVSVLMTSYNREKYIADAIESVLASSLKNFELIIVDDRSTDKTVSIAKSYEIKDGRIKVYINEKNLGDYSNRNKASEYAEGKYIKYLDSDDLLYPHGLEEMVNSMEKFPEACIGFSNKLTNFSLVLPALVSSQQAYQEHFFKGGFLTNGPTGSIYKKEFFDKIGKFEPKFGVASDFQFNLKAALHFPVVVFKRDLFWWRQHELQEINLKKDVYEKLNFIITKEFLQKPNCPLDDEERKIAINNLQNLYARKVLSTAANFQIADFLEKFTLYNLSTKDLFFSLMPGKIRRRLQSI